MLIAMSAMTTPIEAKSTWATKTSSPSPDGIGRIPGHHLDAGFLGRLRGRRDLIAGIVGDHDRVLALRGGSRHDLDLPGYAVFRRRADETQFASVFQLLMSLFGALMGLIENQNAEKLRQQDHIGFLAGLGLNSACIGGAGQAKRKRNGDGRQ